MTEFKGGQISFSTAEEEEFYFTGGLAAAHTLDPSVVLPPGTYRVIDGELFLIVAGTPAELAVEPKQS